MRTFAKQLCLAAGLMILVAGVCYGLGYGFYQHKPLRDADYFSLYVGDKTFCRTVNYYDEKGDAKRVAALLAYAEENAMSYLRRRFGKDKGAAIVNACELQRHEALKASCRAEPHRQVEHLVLEYNKPTVRKKKLI
ncbi:hypothetical protein FCL40_06010 [Ferrimonas sediminicola]|uniref:Uncharacterized protein n=1 Tax=Ferrimonas sediminicola TaxID=2569538 RepID=A0A4U1BF33_9GAMM|nr:hypothetical protein [Ferrimonas sediminicola]TKB49711.1 hypothetical protein FCL40_06010 [Ferrimonas sediminicola]